MAARRKVSAEAEQEEGDRRVNVAALRALAEPTRLRIVELIRDSPMSVGEIAERLGLGQPQTSKHLRVLSQARLVEVHADANRRIYSLRREQFERLREWLETFTRQQEERYDRLEAYLAETGGEDRCSPAPRRLEHDSERP